MTGDSKHCCIKRLTVMKKQNRQKFKKMNYMQLYQRYITKIQMNNNFMITKQDFLKLFDSKSSNFILRMLKYIRLFDIKLYKLCITKILMYKDIHNTNKYDTMITNESKFSKLILAFPIFHKSYFFEKCMQKSNLKRSRIIWHRIKTSVDENTGVRGTLTAAGQSPMPRITTDKRISYRRFQYSMKRDHPTEEIYHVHGVLNIRGTPPVTYRLFMDRFPMLYPFLTRKSGLFGAHVVLEFGETVYRDNYQRDLIIRHGPDTSANENAETDETTLNETISQCTNEHSTECDPSTEEISFGNGGLFNQSVTYALFRSRLYSFINDGVVNYNGPQITLTEIIPQWHSTEGDFSTEVISLGDAVFYTQSSPSITYQLFRDRWARILSFQDFGPPEILAFSGFSHIDNISAETNILDGRGTSANENAATDESRGAGVNYNGPQITLTEIIPQCRNQESTERDLSTEDISLGSGGFFTQISPGVTYPETPNVNLNQLEVAPLTDTIPRRWSQERVEIDVSTGEISQSYRRFYTQVASGILGSCRIHY